MNADRAAEAAEHLAELSQPASAALEALRHASSRAETAPQIVIAFDAILAGHSGPMLSSAGFAAIIDATKRMRDTAVDVLHPAIQRPKLHACIEAAVGLVCYWASTTDERARTDPDALTSSIALSRILRNTVESICLVDMLRDQETARRQAVVNRIKAEALAASSAGGARVA